LMKCRICGTEMEPDPEDSGEWYCPTCNYGFWVQEDEG